MEGLEHLLTAFDRVGLNTVNRHQPESRLETKYLMPLEQLTGFIKAMTPSYSLLTVNASSILNYTTRYFDTPDMQMYLAHHNGKLNRYKIRERTYADSGQTYLEVKFKNNTDRTYKQRLLRSSFGAVLEAPERQFLALQSPYDPLLLKPSLEVHYKRIMLINKQGGERVTIDLDMDFTTGVSGHKLSKFVVVETKQAQSIKTPARTELEVLKIRPRSFSKYCFGISCLYPAIKKNNFKKKFASLNKTENDHTLHLVTGF